MQSALDRFGDPAELFSVEANAPGGASPPDRAVATVILMGAPTEKHCTRQCSYRRSADFGNRRIKQFASFLKLVLALLSEKLLLRKAIKPILFFRKVLARLPAPPV
jgi:hypothetical protein